MKILFTFIGGSGHFVPLVPVARAALAAGHTVAFGCGPTMVGTVEEAGFDVFQLGTGKGRAAKERLPLQPVTMEREERVLRAQFVKKGARKRVPLTGQLCKRWKPDVLVCDEVDFGGMIAAEKLGIPYVPVSVIASGSFVRASVVGAALNRLRVMHGLSPDPDLRMLQGHLLLSPFPPSFRDPAYPLPKTAYIYFPFAGEVSAAPLLVPEWSTLQPDWPTVYFTLGTIFNWESGDLFERVLAGLRELPIKVIATLGRGIDPAELGEQPPHIVIKRYIPQERVLPHVQMVVSHGGSGSVAGTLAHGLPSVVIPMGADQPLNGKRIVDLGMGQMLNPAAVTPEDVRDAVSEVLENPAYRRVAERLRDEFRALPGVESAVRKIERLMGGAGGLSDSRDRTR